MLPLVAHGFADAGALPIPLPLLMAGSAGTLIAATRVPTRAAAARTTTPPADLPLLADRSIPATAARVLAALLLFGLLVPALLGPPDVGSNPAPRLLFTLAWAGLVPASLLLGPVWRTASPLRALSRLVEGDGGASSARPLPATTGVWPAVVAAAVFSYAEHVAPHSGPVIAVFVGSYLLVQFAAAARYGAGWYAAGDVFEVYSAVLGTLAPLGRDRAGRVRPRSPRRLLSTWSAPPGVIAFVGVLVGANLYDALEPTGGGAMRSSWLALCMALAVAVLLAGTRPPWLAPATAPLLAGHAAAHYLAPLLIDTQVTAVLASDPLGRGWDLLGLTRAPIVAEPIPPWLGLSCELALLVAGHACAAVVAGDLARARLPRKATRAALFPFHAAVAVSLLAGVWLRFAGL